MTDRAVQKRMSVHVAVVAALLSVFFSAGSRADLQPDYEREKRLEQEAIAGLFDGEVVYLNDGNRDFLSILSEPDDLNYEGAILLLHGRGFHPDWPQVTGPLREGLGEMGMTTLSLQMPVLAKDAKYYEYLEILGESFPRIESGIELLRSKGYPRVVVVAHSCSVHMTMGWVKKVGDGLIDAFVGIGMGATDFGQPMLEEFPLSSMSVPVLDIFGDEDYPAVVKAADSRMSAISTAGNPKSSQVRLVGPDHFFEDYEDDLVEAVGEWILSLRVPD